MTVTIKYQSQFSNDTLTSYTQQWATTHGDIKDTQAIRLCQGRWPIFWRGVV